MADTGPSIAPSVFGTGVIPDLPEVVSDSQPVAGAGPPPPPADVAPPPPPPAAAPPPPPPAGRCEREDMPLHLATSEAIVFVHSRRKQFSSL